jgi:hypothetical protein
MITNEAKSRVTLTNRIFSSFVLSVFGWGLIQAWSLRYGASVMINGLVAAVGLALSGVAIHRCLRHWPSAATSKQEAFIEATKVRTIGWSTLLVAIGCVLGVLAAADLFLLAVFAVGVNFVPWSKIPVCHSHFFVSAGMIGSGAAIGAAVFGRPLDSFIYPFAAGICWMIACSTLLLVATLDKLEQLKHGAGERTLNG